MMAKRAQRGVIAQGYVWLLGALAVLGLAWLITSAITSFIRGVEADARQAGRDACDTAYKARDNAALRSANERIVQLEEAARKTERAHAAALAAIGVQLRKEQDNAKDTEARILAGIADGTLRVRPGALQAGECPAGGAASAGPAPGAGAAGSNAATQCRLSDATARSLLDIGRDADDTARALAAAQAVILEDRRICGVE